MFRLTTSRMHCCRRTCRTYRQNCRKKQHVVKNEIVEVDLHIHELLDDTTGMGNAEMLNYQLDVFRKTLEEYKQKKGQRIVFITVKEMVYCVGLSWMS